MNHKKTNHKTIATLLALIPGFGHFYNKQYWQGGAILTILAAYVCLTMNTVVRGTQGGGIAGLFRGRIIRCSFWWKGCFRSS